MSTLTRPSCVVADNSQLSSQHRRAYRLTLVLAMRTLMVITVLASCVSGSWRPDGVDPYDVLGLQRDSTIDDAILKRAYRKAAMKWHPDKVAAKDKKVAEEKFIEIAWAYEVLGDPTRRAEFDNPQWQQTRPQQHGRGQDVPFESYSMEEAMKVFSGVFGKFSDEYAGLVKHLASASSLSGSKEHWRKHAEDILEEVTSKGKGNINVETRSKDGRERTKTSRSATETRKSDGSTVRVEKSSSTHTVSSSSSTNVLHGGSADHHHAIHQSHEAAHRAAMEAAQRAHRDAMSRHQISEL
eukprot:TRINITY_DN74283_c0_g1_i1.p1 TRINITY_DN74283_c0_g1~~TRINITY_DN74283_c0_g1_i1.p1  ORF type:complete len:297 (-),score=46.44 TRINITY_DN74283_c0_g1_i1:135-1025(-)